MISPVANIEISRVKNNELYQFRKDLYMESVHNPTLVEENEYEADQLWMISVRYQWFGSPHRDYTVKVHSKFADIEVFDEEFKTNQLHADGQSPSEFTSGEYCGMDGSCTPNEPYNPNRAKPTASQTLSLEEKSLLKGTPKQIELQVTPCTSNQDCWAFRNDYICAITYHEEWKEYKDQVCVEKKDCQAPGQPVDDFYIECLDYEIEESVTVEQESTKPIIIKEEQEEQQNTEPIQEEPVEYEAPEPVIEEPADW